MRLLYLDQSLRPYIDQINDIELAVNALENSAYKLDAYSKQLGRRITAFAPAVKHPPPSIPLSNSRIFLKITLDVF